ncbi:hypothetical protein FJ693_00470 [Georgenia yuyongxinii]|uniref:Uncharacterized protein n=1 Tax=Georgenia yuyongxinii TaxID=2589797 RepID=A0A552WXX8_9MICO|nr:hypothetical protein FJ693_00470 [Georgenia yuyongxinii]
MHAVVVTGRPPRWMPPVLDAAAHKSTLICANWAIVLDSES